MGFEYSSFRMNKNTELLEEELDLLRRTKIAILRSQLNSGLLLIPDGLQVWNSEIEDEPNFEEELSDYLLNSVQDVDSLTSFMPFIIRGPKDLLEEVRHLRFTDERAVEVIQDRIDVIEDRIAKINGTMVE